jgi:hypothetical protein
MEFEGFSMIDVVCGRNCKRYSMVTFCTRARKNSSQGRQLGRGVWYGKTRDYWIELDN